MGSDQQPLRAVQIFDRVGRRGERKGRRIRRYIRYVGSSEVQPLRRAPIA